MVLKNKINPKNGIKVIQYVGPADREIGASRLTVYADNYDAALEALASYRRGEIIPTKFGIDVRTKVNT